MRLMFSHGLLLLSKDFFASAIRHIHIFGSLMEMVSPARDHKVSQILPVRISLSDQMLN